MKQTEAEAKFGSCDGLTGEYASKEFAELKRMISNLSGISLDDSKNILVKTRLQKRIRRLKLCGMTSYLKYVKANTTKSWN